jgi:hypothetical protein
MKYLETVIENPGKLKSKPQKIEKFIERIQIDKNAGEILKTKNIFSLNMEKIREYTELMRYYIIATPEIDEPDREIINKYHGLSRIEDSFRVIKSDLEDRPVYVSTPEHINAHFLICFIALTMIGLIQYRVLKYQGKEEIGTDSWEAGVTAERIKSSLLTFKADSLPRGYYKLTEIPEDLNLILKALGISINLILPTISDLRQLKYSIDKSSFMLA